MRAGRGITARGSGQLPAELVARTRFFAGDFFLDERPEAFFKLTPKNLA
jgi:hypothetical protein